MQFSVGSILVRFEVQFLETYQRFRRFEVRLCGSENLSEHFWHEIVLSNFGIYVVVGRISASHDHGWFGLAKKFTRWMLQKQFFQEY